MAESMIKVEDKLYFNRFVVDAGKPHISVRPHKIPSAQLRSLEYMCPAGCYSANDQGQIEIAPIAYMRGRTLNNAFVVIDEAQNCTYGQIKMLLTRLGWHSTMVVTGDPDQSDLLPGVSGLADIGRRLEAIDGIAVVRLGERDVVRHPLVATMLQAL